MTCIAPAADWELHDRESDRGAENGVTRVSIGCWKYFR
jgi:hypothetical protein